MHTKRRLGERGQGLVELALIFPVFVVLVMGVMDFAWCLRSYVQVTNAGREGARYGVTGASVTDIKNWIEDTSSGLVDCDPATECEAKFYKSDGTQCYQAPATPTCVTGDMIEITVRYTYKWITPLGQTLPTVSLSSFTRMRLE